MSYNGHRKNQRLNEWTNKGEREEREQVRDDNGEQWQYWEKNGDTGEQL